MFNFSVFKEIFFVATIMFPMFIVLPKTAGNWIKGSTCSQTKVMQTQNGMTTDVNTIQDALLKFWKGLFNQLAEGDLSWEELKEYVCEKHFETSIC